MRSWPNRKTRGPGFHLGPYTENTTPGRRLMRIEAKAQTKRYILHLSLTQREAIAFYLFVSPWLAGFLLFTLGPMIAAFLLSFTFYDVISPPRWVWFENYRIMFFTDPLFWQALKVTFIYVFGSVPLHLAAALFVALLMNQSLPGIYFFRTVYYLPSIIGGVPVALLWLWIYNPSFGIANWLLSLVGIKGPQWLFDEFWVIPALIIMGLWGIGGAMLIFLAALQGIPRHLYEAAQLDGAGILAQFRHVTLPMLSPVIFFNLVMGIIHSFQVFTNVFIMTQGGPANASLVYVLHLYRNAFSYFKMGYAAALAWFLFLVILAITLLIIKSSPAWVYYEGMRGGRQA